MIEPVKGTDSPYNPFREACSFGARDPGVYQVHRCPDSEVERGRRSEWQRQRRYTQGTKNSFPEGGHEINND